MKRAPLVRASLEPIHAPLTLKSTAIREGSRILMQDLLDDRALDVTACCVIRGGSVTLPGELITEIGTSCNHEGDTSEPGLIVKIINA